MFGKRIKALEQRVADLEKKLDRIELDRINTAIECQLFRETKAACDEFRKEKHKSCFPG